LQIHWRDARGERLMDTASTARLPAQSFNIPWREDGFDLPAPLSRHVVQLGWSHANGSPYTRTLDMLQPGETFQNACVKSGYRRVAWQARIHAPHPTAGHRPVDS
jgi:hypothetical protein